MHSTRRAILQALHTEGQAAIKDLADRVGVKAITIRHHMTALLADGLVAMEAQRQSVGRPLHVYSLSEKGQALFPPRYSQIISRLIGQFKESLSPASTDALVESLTDDLSEYNRTEIAHLPLRQRVRHLIKLLTRDGFAAQWQQTDEGLRLVEHNCPFYTLGLEHPEICQIDEKLIRTALNVEVQKTNCLLAGDNACTYLLRNA